MTSLEMKVMLVNEKTNHDIKWRVYDDKSGRRRIYIMMIDDTKYTTKTYEQTDARHKLETLLSEVKTDAK